MTVLTNPAGQTCTVTNGSGTVGSADVTNVAVACTTVSAGPVSDDFNRADGSLGSAWTDMSDGGLAISSQMVTGTNASYSGDIRTGESYTADQYSQIEVTSTQLSGGQWVGPGVRAQSGGQNLYLGIYFWNNGNPQLRLYKRLGGNWTQLGASFSTGPLAAGSQLRLTAVGSTLAFSLNGTVAITATDTDLNSGNPAIMAYGTPLAANWTGASVTGGPGVYTIGGTMSSLTGSVVLQDNGGDNLAVSANGSFTFPTPLVAGGAYTVTVLSNPAGQTCTVSNGSGTVGAANVTNVAVACTNGTGYTAGGTVSGLTGSVVLEDNGGDDLSVSANGSFTFPTPLAAGAAYTVTVLTNPAGQTCTVTNGSGTVGSADVTNVAVACTTVSAGPVSDDFNRADGSLGSAWTDMSDGGLAISSQMVTGTNASYSGDIRTGESYTADQYSQIEVTSTQLSGGQWVGPGVRAQSGGQNLYLGIYFWNNGNPQLRLYKRLGGNWTQLGGSFSTGPLAAGSQLRLTAVGSTLAFSLNGTVAITATDTDLNSGNPAIMADGTPLAANWTGGDLAFEYMSTDSNGVQSYTVTSPDDGNVPETVRVLSPTHPAAGVAHNFLYLLPVEAGLGTTYGDGMATVEALDAEDQYNLTIIEPSFAIDPWYANNPTDTTVQYETFMTTELQPWVKANLSTTGSEQHWLMGFSKSGIGGEDLILKHPDLFSLVASWDFPADMSSYDQYGASSSYGTEANFAANYQLTSAFVDARKSPFLTYNRIWIGGYDIFQSDVSDYDGLLTSEGIAHTMGPSQMMAHRWDSGWVSGALAGLHQDSLNLPPGS